ncbi:MAG: oligopeptide transporter, OPT family [Chlamydiae bacterium]|nr:oligopeptide transporter, OPT family [Chlamydiota bacterium]
MEEPQFKPYIGGEQSTKEFTLRAVILGIILGFIFAVGNAYLGLKIGMTISASIPAAVFSMTIMKALFKDGFILEHNLVQTMASVGEAIAASVIFVFPAFFFLGLTPSSLEIFLIILIGGVTGILFMIPMRRYVIVKEHGKLQFPEGTACAEILRAGEEKEHDGAFVAGFGLLIGAVYKFFVSGIKLFEESIKFNLFKPNGVLTLEATPSLIGVGFIIGPRIASTMFAGGLMGWWILIPLISTFGVSDTIIYPASVNIDSLDSYGIWSNYIRYVGAGAVAVGGIFSLAKIAPIALSSVLEGFKDIFKGLKHSPDLPRTDRDIPMGFLILGSIVSIFLIWALPIFQMNLVSVIITVILAFFFTGVVSITVGLVGSSTNPTSGMLICSLLISCTLFFVLGWTEKIYLLMSLTSVAFISVAICLASATSQDLKTGYLLGATPAKLQIAEMIGLILPALVMGSILHLLNQAYGLGSIDLPAPQATLLSFIANGILKGDLPYIFVMIGVFLGLILAILRLPILPFAIGLYLPLDLSTTIMLGGLVHALIERLGSVSQKGILAASGLVAGDACMGVLIALLSILGMLPNNQISIINETGSFFTLLGVALILGLMAYRKK